MQRASSAPHFQNLLDPHHHHHNNLYRHNNDADGASSSSSAKPRSRPHSPVQASVQLHRQDSSILTNPNGNDSSYYGQPAMATAISAMQPPTAPIASVPAADRPTDLPRPYKCPLCDKAFHRLEHQTRHIRTHTGEKPHSCTFSGCTKRFSRSDELTRHSRIHNNPNSRRNNKAQHGGVSSVAVNGGGSSGNNNNNSSSNGMAAATAHAHAVAAYAQEQAMLAPIRNPAVVAPFSAPASQINSPNVSPPSSFAQATNGKYHQLHTPAGSPRQNHSTLDINLLATAARQVEEGHREPHHNPSVARHAGAHHHSSLLHHPYQPTGRHPPSSLAAYAFSNPHSANSTATNSPSLSRSHSPARQSLISPQSTAPSSPSFSHDSLSPTPDHTPLATPAHSPRLRPFVMQPSSLHTSSSSSSISHLGDPLHSGVQLPALRSLSLGGAAMHGGPVHLPALAPLEPSTEPSSFASAHPNTNTSPYGSYSPAHGFPSKGSRLSDIIHTNDGSQRKLPVPQISGNETMASRDMMDERPN